MMSTKPESLESHKLVRHQRVQLLRQLTTMLDMPMTVLAFVWIILLIIDLTRGLTGWLSTANTGIWILFVVHFVLEFSIAPDKARYLKHHWLTALALLLPAIRVFRTIRIFRALRAARAVRSAGLLRVLSSLNRGVKALRSTVKSRALGFVSLSTLLVTFAGAAGMYAFENPSALREDGYAALADHGGGLPTYGEAVWWTAMTMTTMGSDYFPKTLEGRLLGWALAVYAFAIFGYITASIASYFVGRDRAVQEDSNNVAVLTQEVEKLRKEVAQLISALAAQKSTQ
jgi:voltage-gated potassium channel